MLILILGTALVAASALLLSSRLADGSVTQWLVGAYVIGITEIIVVSLLLSLGSQFRRWPLIVALLGVLVLSALAARRVECPPVRAPLRRLAPVFRDPAVLILAVVVVGIVGYSIALGLFRPPNDGDALGYHLARAAFWRQEHAIDYIPGARDARLNSFAPNSEIVMAYTMVTSGTGRYAPLVQLVAGLASGLAVFGLARRIGARLREAVLAGLLFVTLPVVAMQLSTGLNDVIVASFVACAAFFLVGSTTANAILAADAVGLSVGAKLTGILSLPGLALVALAAHGRRAIRVLAIAGIGVIAGAYWYWFDLTRGNGFSGGVSSERVGADLTAAVARVSRLLLDTVELPGAIGLERVWYLVAAAVLAGVALARRRFRDAAIAGAFVLTPLLLVPFDHLLARGTQKAFLDLGRRDVAFLDVNRHATKASPIYSWYGPASVLLTLLAFVLIVRGLRRKSVPTVAIVLGVSPVIWIVLLGIAVPYWEWNGRYIIGGWALACAAWALALRIRPVAWATVALALVTATLAFIHQHDRASGARLLAADHEPSVWSIPSWHIQATDHPVYAQILKFVEQKVPRDARIAIQPYVWPHPTFDFSWPVLPYPYFGPGLKRTVLFASTPSRARSAHADWALLLRRKVRECAPGWRRALVVDRWVVLERTHPSTSCESHP
jgi:hypothetical protein